MKARWTAKWWLCVASLGIASVVIADKGITEMIEANKAFAIDIDDDIVAQISAVNSFAKEGDAANARLQGLLNAVNQELVLIQQRLQQEQSSQNPDPHVIDILQDKLSILSGTVGAMSAATASDSALIAALDALRVKLVEVKNQAIHFENAMRTILGNPTIPAFTDPGRTPQGVPTYTLPNSPGLGDFVDDNSVLLNTIADAVDDGKPAKTGTTPDKADVIVDNKKVLDDLNKKKDGLIKKINKEIGKLEDSVVSGDPRITTKINELRALRNSLGTIDTAASDVALDVDAINVSALRDAIAKAIQDMKDLRKRTP
ncbi:MAG: hypothetical protein K8T20_10630 [Planctomycetes bacterium]|nr:hypothetical protein [Planctomycetota bacterium]